MDDRDSLSTSALLPERRKQITVSVHALHTVFCRVYAESGYLLVKCSPSILASGFRTSSQYDDLTILPTLYVPSTPHPHCGQYT